MFWDFVMGCIFFYLCVSLFVFVQGLFLYSCKCLFLYSCMCHFLSLCKCLFLYLCKCLFLYLCMCLFLSLYKCLFLSLCRCLFLSLCVCLFLYLCMCLFLYFCVYGNVTFCSNLWGGRWQGGDRGEMQVSYWEEPRFCKKHTLSREAKIQTRTQAGQQLREAIILQEHSYWEEPRFCKKQTLSTNINTSSDWEEPEFCNTGKSKHKETQTWSPSIELKWK